MTLSEALNEFLIEQASRGNSRATQLVLFNSAPAEIQRELERNTEFWLVPMKEKPRSERRETRIK